MTRTTTIAQGRTVRRAVPLLLGATFALTGCSGGQIAGFADSTTTAPANTRPADDTPATSASSTSTTSSPAETTSSTTGVGDSQPVSLGDPIATATIPAALDGDPKATLTVKLYSLTRRGQTLIGNFSFTLNSTTSTDPTEMTSLFRLLGDRTWSPTLIDTTNLKRHAVLDGDSIWDDAATSSGDTKLGAGDTVAAFAAFAAPPAEVTSMVVNMAEGAPGVDVKLS